MRGIPEVFNTKDDWLNTCEYVNTAGNADDKMKFIERLKELKKTGTALVLKADVKKDPEELTADDFTAQTDPAAAIALTGLTLEEIDSIIEKIK